MRERDDTGVGNVVVAPGATGAETIETDSAAGGNAARPERRIPQDSGADEPPDAIPATALQSRPRPST